MERTFTFMVSVTIEDTREEKDGENLSDEALGEAQDAAVNAARAALVAQYATVQDLADNAEVAEEDDSDY